MNDEYYIFNSGPQVAPQVSKLLRVKLDLFVKPLLVQLDQHLDKRLVATFFGLLVSIISFRDRVNALLLAGFSAGRFIPRKWPAPLGTPTLVD